MSLLEGIEPQTSSYKSGKFRKHIITKQVLTKRIDDQNYLQGPYRIADWAELTVEHVTSDIMQNVITGKISAAGPEHYLLKFTDYTRYSQNPTAQGISQEIYAYEFIPGTKMDAATITEFGYLRNYAVFKRAFEHADKLLAI